jgi:hypothetical protein
MVSGALTSKLGKGGDLEELCERLPFCGVDFFEEGLGLFDVFQLFLFLFVFYGLFFLLFFFPLFGGNCPKGLRGEAGFPYGAV